MYSQDDFEGSKEDYVTHNPCIHLDNSAPQEYGLYCSIDQKRPIKVVESECHGCSSYTSSPFERWWKDTGCGMAPAYTKALARLAWEGGKKEGTMMFIGGNDDEL